MMTKTVEKPVVGEQAPMFSLSDEAGKIHDLEEYYRKKNVVLIFYPGDDTPGCIVQLCAVRDDWEEFRKRDLVVLGVNQAGSTSHRHFIEKYGLKNPLLIDEGRRVARLYGAVGQFFGHETTKRTVVIIGKDGTVHYYRHGMPSNSEIFEVLDRVSLHYNQATKEAV